MSDDSTDLSGLGQGLDQLSSKTTAAMKALTTAGQDAGRALMASFDGAFESLGRFSAAEERLAALQKVTAAQQQANEEAKVQAVLASLAKEASMKAILATAEGFAYLAGMKYDSAAESFTAAGIYAALAGASAAGAAGIGATRGATTQEQNEFAKYAGTSGSGGTGGSASGGSGGVTVNIVAGQGLLVTSADLDKAIGQAFLDYNRLR